MAKLPGSQVVVNPYEDILIGHEPVEAGEATTRAEAAEEGALDSLPVGEVNKTLDSTHISPLGVGVNDDDGWAHTEATVEEAKPSEKGSRGTNLPKGKPGRGRKAGPDEEEEEEEDAGDEEEDAGDDYDDDDGQAGDYDDEDADPADYKDPHNRQGHRHRPDPNEPKGALNKIMDKAGTMSGIKGIMRAPLKKKQPGQD